MIYAKNIDVNNICLNYHAFSGLKANDNIESIYTVDFEKFQDHLGLLTEIQNISISELFEPPKINFSYSLTFDDGYKSHIRIAEELAKRNLKGTFYIITNEVSKNKKFLTKKDLLEMVELGMEIGSHTCSHRHVNRLPTNEMIKELRVSKAFLEDIINMQVVSISYPGGHFGKREVKQSIIEGYSNQRTCITGFNILPIKNHFIKCYNIKNFVDLAYLNQLIGPSPNLRNLIKIRELGLYIPKYLHSRFQFNKLT